MKNHLVIRLSVPAVCTFLLSFGLATCQYERSCTTGWSYNGNGGNVNANFVRGRGDYMGLSNEKRIVRMEDSLDFNSENSQNGLAGLAYNMESVPDYAFEYERYSSFEENDWMNPSEEALSTFSIDVDQASYTNFRRYVNEGSLPPKDAIRIEEWLNYFNYEFEAPTVSSEHPLKVTSEISACPWEEEDELIMIKMQGQLPPEENLPASNIVFLVDVSGSMQSENKLTLVQKSMLKLVEKLRPEDKFSIVTYAGNWAIPLQPTSGNQKGKIQNAINNMKAGGSTAGSEGLNTAYDLAVKNFIPNGNNRVILASDGDWNVGTTSNNALKKLIEEKRETGVYLSVLGFGMGNYNDGMMEILADNGNGNYAYVDSEKEADRIFNTEFAGAMYTIAKDVKLQVEFDAQNVDSYRLIGYENRVLEAWQFNNDTIDAGDLGMGQNVVAFYQIKRKKGSEGALGKLKFRYKPIESDKSIFLTHEFSDFTSDASSDFNFASSVIEFALCLRESEYRGSAQIDKAIVRGKNNLGDPKNKIGYEKRIEFVGKQAKVGPQWKNYVVNEAPEMEKPIVDDLKLYPNPATEFTTVEVPREVMANWSVQLFDMNGQLHQVKHYSETTTARIDLNGLSKGTYIVKVYSEGMSLGYLKVVKQ